MKFLDIVSNSLNETPAQTRVEKGLGFEKWFGETYRVKEADPHLKRSNVEVRFESEPQKFPGMKLYKEITPGELYIMDENGSAFRLLKADFKNLEKNIYNEEKQEYVEINGEKKGNLFELKQGASSFNRRLMFAEFKKTATRDDIIRKFGDEAINNEWSSLKKEEQKSRWAEFLKKIEENFSYQLSNYNEIINYIKDELNRIKPEVEGSIRHRLKAVLHGRGWYLAKGKKDGVKFYRINVDNFVENIVFQTTAWAGVNRIKVDISPSMVENYIKNDIKSLTEEENEEVTIAFNITADLEGEINVNFAKEKSAEVISFDETEQLVASTDFSGQNLI